MRTNNIGISAEEYLAFHNIDLQHSVDLKGTHVIESIIPSSAIQNARESLGLTKKMMAVLMGCNLPAWIRYENISIAPYPQGSISRKMGILINWLADEKAKRDILNLLSRESGLATLSGLLQSESVTTFLALDTEDEMMSQENPEVVPSLTKTRVVGNA